MRRNQPIQRVGLEAVVVILIAAGSAGVKQLEKPFILSEGLPPVPYKLASKILWGEYIDMAELLRDNLEAQNRAATTAVATPHPASTTKNTREVPDILSWVQCFGLYMAVVTSTFPERTKELLSYQTLIVREVLWCNVVCSRTFCIGS